MIRDVVCLASMPRDHSIILSFVKNKIVHRAYANEIVIDITAGTEHNVKPRKMASSRWQRADPENSILVGVLTTFVLDINVVFQKGPYGPVFLRKPIATCLISRGLGPPATSPSGPTHGQLQCIGATPQYNALQIESLRSLSPLVNMTHCVRVIPFIALVPWKHWCAFALVLVILSGICFWTFNYALSLHMRAMDDLVWL